MLDSTFLRRPALFGDRFFYLPDNSAGFRCAERQGRRDRRGRHRDGTASDGRSRVSEYTVLVEAGRGRGAADGDEWQALAPPQTTAGDSAVEVARWTAVNQDAAEGHWRVRVWEGADADTSADPAAEVYGETSS
jgi:hypothetical protein